MTQSLPGTGVRAASPGRTVVFFVIALFGSLPVLGMLAFQFIGARPDVGSACSAGGLPPDAVISEGPPRDAFVTSFPAGRYCEWESLSGGVTAYQTGWPTTIIGCAATALVVWMTVLALRERRPKRPWIALLPMALVFVAWVLVFL